MKVILEIAERHDLPKSTDFLHLRASTLVATHHQLDYPEHILQRKITMAHEDENKKAWEKGGAKYSRYVIVTLLSLHHRPKS
jgi:hypothetical protein